MKTRLPSLLTPALATILTVFAGCGDSAPAPPPAPPATDGPVAKITDNAEAAKKKGPGGKTTRVDPNVAKPGAALSK